MRRCTLRYDLDSPGSHSEHAGVARRRPQSSCDTPLIQRLVALIHTCALPRSLLLATDGLCTSAVCANSANSARPIPGSRRRQCSVVLARRRVLASFSDAPMLNQKAERGLPRVGRSNHPTTSRRCLSSFDQNASQIVKDTSLGQRERPDRQGDHVFWIE